MYIVYECEGKRPVFVGVLWDGVGADTKVVILIRCPWLGHVNMSR